MSQKLKGTVYRTTDLPISQKSDIIQSVMDSRETIKANLFHEAVKLQLVAKIELKKPDMSGETIITHVSTKQHSLIRIGDFDKVLNDMVFDLNEAISKANLRGSGWTKATVHKLECKQSRYHPILGKSFLPLPKEVEVKKAIVNIQNKKDD